MIRRLALLALALACPAWGAWTTCASITVAPGKLGSSTLANFPVIVMGSYTFMGTVANGGGATSASGYDINFFSDSGCSTKLSWKTVAWSAAGVVEYKVKIPGLSTTSNVFYVGVGNSSVTTDQSAPTAVWDTYYQGVYALNDNAASTTVLDSSGNAINGANVANTSTKSVAGPFANGTIGTGLTYNGSSDYTNLTTNSLLDLGGSWTAEYWLRENTQAGNATIFSKGAYGASGVYVAMSATGQETAYQYLSGFGEGTASSTAALTPGTWYHVMVTSPGVNNGSGLKWYLNGVADGVGFSNASTASSLPMLLGAYTTGAANPAAISLAEFRISTGIVRSADWALADYNNQFAPATFYTISGLPVSIATASLPNANRNVAYSQTVIATGGTTPYTWSVSAGSLPTGLTLNASTGVISGTPTVWAKTAVSFTVKVTDAGSATATQPLSILVNGNAFTAAHTGNWSSTNTSTGPWSSLVGGGAGGVPGYGDTVAVPTGVTLTADCTPCTYGTASASGNELTVASGGALVVSGGLTMRGNMTVGDSGGTAALTMSAGSATTCDTSLSPAATAYTLTVGYQYQHPSLWTIASGATLTSTPGGNNPCYFAQGQVGGLSINWQGAAFSNLYNASSNLLIASLSPGGAGTADVMILKTNTFTATGAIISGGYDPAANIDIEDNKWTSSVVPGSNPTNLQTGQSSGTPTGNRLLLGNSFDLTLRLEYPQNWTVEWNVFNNGLFEYDDTGSAWLPATIANNFSTAAINNMWQIGGNGTIGANYFYYPAAFQSTGGSPQYDPHFMQVGNSITSSVTTIVGSIYEYGFAGGVPVNEEGIAIITSSNVTKAYNCIVLPDGSGAKSSGRLFGTPIGTSTSGIFAQHNTASTNVSSKTGTEIGENSPDYLHQIQNYSYNIAYAATAGAGGYAAQTITDAPPSTTDAMAAATEQYNVSYGLSTGSCANNSGAFSCYGFNAFVFSGTTVPGATDIAVNPNFVDGARNLKKWDLSLGGTGTETDSFARLNANPRTMIPSLLTYVTAGFAPQNPAVCNIDGAGNYAGAVPCAALPPSGAGSVICLGFCAVVHVP